MGRRDGIHDSVVHDVTDVFRGKTAEQLAALQAQIETKLKDTLEGVDVGYWESLLTQLKGEPPSGPRGSPGRLRAGEAGLLPLMAQRLDFCTYVVSWFRSPY